MRRLVLLAVVLVTASMGCKVTESGSLFVDVRTDLRPGDEIVLVRTEVSPMSDSTMIRRAEADVSVQTPRALAEGVRVAELDGLPAGSLVVTAQAIGPDGSVVVARSTRFVLAETGGVLVHLSRSCVGVACPPPGGAPTLRTCVSGMCSDDRCSAMAPEYCPAPECASDSECVVADPTCLTGICADDRCLRISTSEMCASCEVREGICDDMADEDCDGLIDCDDPDCFSATTCCATEEICGNMRDDNCNGLQDCDDFSCVEHPSCDFRRDAGTPDASMADAAVMDGGMICTSVGETCGVGSMTPVGACEGPCGSTGEREYLTTVLTCGPSLACDREVGTGTAAMPCTTTACMDSGSISDAGPLDTGLTDSSSWDSSARVDSGIDSGPRDSGFDSGGPPTDSSTPMDSGT